jgi:hypothetical protein
LIKPIPNQTGGSFYESAIQKLIKELGGRGEEFKPLLRKMWRRRFWRPWDRRREKPIRKNMRLVPTAITRVTF